LKHESPRIKRILTNLLQPFVQIRLIRADSCLRASAYSVIAALCACQPNPSPQTQNTVASPQHLAVCDGTSVSLYAISPNQTNASPIKPELLLTLDPNTHCPQWTPNGAQAILATELVTGRTKMDEVRNRTQLRWFDARTRQAEDFVTLSELDGAFVPIWQAQAKPRFALLSLRDADQRCLTQATLLMAGVMCGNVHAEAFYLEPEGRLNQLTLLPEPPCRLLPSPNGLWLAVAYGNCGGLRQHLNLVRLDTGETLSVPLDLSVHGLDDIAWQPDSSAIAITARRQSRIITKSKALKQQFNDVLLYTLADQKLVTLISGLAQLQLLRWLHNDNGTLLYVEGGMIWRQRISESGPSPIARIKALAQPALKACSPSFSLSQDDELLAWQESCDGVAAHTGWLNLRTGLFGASDAMRNYKGVIRLSPDHRWIASITAERAQGTMMSRASLINTQTGQSIDLGFCPPGTQIRWLEMD
jgi:hypothetical protein